MKEIGKKGKEPKAVNCQTKENFFPSRGMNRKPDKQMYN